MSEFKKEEYWLVKWPLASLVLCLCLCGALLFGLSTLNTTATTEVRRARAALDEARSSVEKIEEEEATIIEYIGRYQLMEQDGVVSAEDRLQFQENLANLRNQFSLFPVSLNIEGQSSLPLEHADGGTEEGRQILLNTSLVQFTLPLLHEDDFTRLVSSLVEGPGLLQPLSCSLTAASGTTSFVYLAQHFNAECTLNWYTFRLPPPVEEAE